VLAVGPPPGADGGGTAVIDGYEPREDEAVYLPWIWADPDYFDLLGLPLLRGRGFGEADRPDSPPVVVINESLVARYFGTADPIGRRVRVVDGSTGEGGVATTELEIVGVVPDVRVSLQDAPGPLIYRAYRQGSAIPSTVVVRTKGDPTSVVPRLQQAVQELDAAVPIIGATTVTRKVTDELGPGRAMVAFVGALGALGLGLAGLGLYAVVAFAVSRRAREIGIRRALGAQRPSVLWTLSKDVAALMAGALTVGLGLAWLLVGQLATVVANLGEAEGVNLNSAPSADVVAFGLVAGIMGAVALTATLVPAWRASGRTPNEVLREL